MYLFGGGLWLVALLMEPDELFAFVSGRLQERFIGSAAALERRLGSSGDAARLRRHDSEE